MSMVNLAQKVQTRLFRELQELEQFTFIGGTIKLFRADVEIEGQHYNALYVEDGMPTVIAPLCEVVPQNFWVCSEVYQGSGRLSRTWIEQGPTSPDAAQECNPDCMIYHQRGSGSCGSDGGCIPYPFNGMGGRVEGGPFITRDDAEAFESNLND